MNAIHSLSQSESKDFCYLYTRVISSTYIGYIEIISGLVFLLYTIRHWLRIRKLSAVTRNLQFIYVAIIVWVLLLECQMIICETVYWTYHNKTDSIQKSNQLTIFSRYVFLLDVLQFFVLQGLIFLVCYNWMEVVITFLEQLSEIEGQNKAETLKILKMQIWCKKIIKFILLFRFVFYGSTLMVIFFIDQNIESMNLQMVFIFLLIQAFFLPFLLGISMYTVKSNKRINQLMDQQEIKRLVNQYIILIICALVKFGFGLLEVVQSINKNYNVQCVMDYTVSNTELAQTIVMFVTEFIFQYCLPILVILRIFNVQQDTEISDSLLQTQKYRSNNGSFKS